MIIAKYLTKEVLKTQMAVMFVLLAIFISQYFVKFLANASEGDFPTGLVFTLVALNLPKLAILIIPLSLFLAILLTHGRMYSENEMVVLHAIGVSEWYVVRITLFLAVLNCIFTAYLSLYLSPWAQTKEEAIMKQVKADAGLSSVIKGRFQKSPKGDVVFFVEDIDNNNALKKIFVTQSIKNKHDLNIVVANSGNIDVSPDGSQRLELQDGERYSGLDGDLNYQVLKFGSYSMQIKDREAKETKHKLGMMTNKELWNENSHDSVAEYHWRLSFPISIIMLSIIAVPLSRVNKRQGKFGKLLPAIIVYLCYFGLTMVGKRAIESGSVSLNFGLWWVHGIVFILGIIFVFQNRSLGIRLNSKLRSFVR